MVAEYADFDKQVGVAAFADFDRQVVKFADVDRQVVKFADFDRQVMAAKFADFDKQVVVVAFILPSRPFFINSTTNTSAFVVIIKTIKINFVYITNA